MVIYRFVPCALNKEKCNIVLDDICGMLNYDYPEQQIAVRTDAGVTCIFDDNNPPGNLGLPDCILSTEVNINRNRIDLSIYIDSSKESSIQIEDVADNIRNNLFYLFSQAVINYQTKVFCVGWSRTGTTSITQALRTLGLFSWHFTPWVIGDIRFNSDDSKISINLSAVDKYNAVSDIPVCALFRELDRAYPNSKFILTIREPGAWVESAVSQLNEYIMRQGMMDATARWAYETDVIDRRILLNRYMRHNQEVLEYFANRADLLVIDITETNQWSKLCGFLDLPIPDEPFPYLNKTAIIK